MSYVFSKALMQNGKEEKDPPKWKQKSNVPPLSSSPTEKNTSPLPKSPVEKSTPPPVARKPKLSTGSMSTQQSSTEQSSVGATRAAAFKKPIRSYSVDYEAGTGSNTGPKMGGAFARLQANLEKPESTGPQSIYSEVYEAYRAKRSLKEHGVLPKFASDKNNTSSSNHIPTSNTTAHAQNTITNPPKLLPKPRRTSLEDKRSTFQRSRADTMPAFVPKYLPTPFVDMSKDDEPVTRHRVSTEGSYTLPPKPPVKAPRAPPQTPPKAAPRLEPLTVNAPENSPEKSLSEDSLQFEKNHAVVEPNEDALQYENFKKVKQPEIDAMQEVFANEKSEIVEGKRRLSDTIDELESIDFRNVGKIPSVAEEEEQGSTIENTYAVKTFQDEAVFESISEKQEASVRQKDEVGLGIPVEDHFSAPVASLIDHVTDSVQLTDGSYSTESPLKTTFGASFIEKVDVASCDFVPSFETSPIERVAESTSENIKSLDTSPADETLLYSAQTTDTTYLEPEVDTSSKTSQIPLETVSSAAIKPAENVNETRSKTSQSSETTSVDDEITETLPKTMSTGIKPAENDNENPFDTTQSLQTAPVEKIIETPSETMPPADIDHPENIDETPSETPQSSKTAIVEQIIDNQSETVSSADNKLVENVDESPSKTSQFSETTSVDDEITEILPKTMSTDSPAENIAETLSETPQSLESTLVEQTFETPSETLLSTDIKPVMNVVETPFETPQSTEIAPVEQIINAPPETMSSIDNKSAENAGETSSDNIHKLETPTAVPNFDSIVAENTEAPFSSVKTLDSPFVELTDTPMSDIQSMSSPAEQVVDSSLHIAQPEEQVIKPPDATESLDTADIRLETIEIIESPPCKETPEVNIDSGTLPSVEEGISEAIPSKKESFPETVFTKETTVISPTETGHMSNELDKKSDVNELMTSEQTEKMNMASEAPEKVSNTLASSEKDYMTAESSEKVGTVDKLSDSSGIENSENTPPLNNEQN